LIHQGVNRFIQLTDDSDEVPKLKGKSYADFRLSAQEWMELDLMREVLQEPADAQQTIEAGVSNLSKWYDKTDDTDVYFICLALDPNYKVAYAKDKWAHCFFETGMRSLERVVCHSSSLTANCILTLHSLIDIIIAILPHRLLQSRLSLSHLCLLAKAPTAIVGCAAPSNHVSSMTQPHEGLVKSLRTT
ncbi:hypothetical protein P692DRAFT_20736237, partial [Suillus brevipes Sb2]